VVVGDVQPAQVFELAKQHFGPLQAEEIPAAQAPAGTPPARAIRTQVKAPAQQPYLIMGYKTPVLNNAAEPWEPYALEMLAAILGDGDSSRLSRNLVRGREIAVSADADYSAFSRLGPCSPWMPSPPAAPAWRNWSRPCATR
jgi:zinc protease